MTFEEWLEQEAGRVKLSELYSTSGEIEDGLRRAWQAGREDSKVELTKFLESSGVHIEGFNYDL